MIELIPNEWRYRDVETKLPTPWYVRPVVEMLYGMDLKGKLVFEYGVGDSTFWYKDHGAKVWGVDSDYDYAYRCGAQWQTHFKAYIDAIDFHLLPEKFDIIVIDGLYRDYCLKKCIGRIKEDGIIIIDNFEQPSADLPDWPLTRNVIEKNNLKLEIYKQEGHQDWATAIVRL